MPITRQSYSNAVAVAVNAHATIGNLLEAVLPRQSTAGLYKETCFTGEESELHISWSHETERMWSWVLQDLEPRMAVLVRANSNLPDPTRVGVWDGRVLIESVIMELWASLQQWDSKWGCNDGATMNQFWDDRRLRNQTRRTKRLIMNDCERL
jgi:hypothetical protein